MKKILLFIIVLFVSNIAIGQYTAAEVEAIEGRKVGALKPVRSDGFWQKDPVTGRYYNVPSVPMTTAELVEQTEELVAAGKYGNAQLGLDRMAIYKSFGTKIIGQTIYSYLSSGVYTMVDAEVVYICVSVNKDDTAISVRIPVVTAGVYTSNNFTGAKLFNFAGEELASTIDSPNAFKSVGWVTLNFISEVAVTPGVYVVALLWSSDVTTTAPILSQNEIRTSFCNIGIYELYAYQGGQASIPNTYNFGVNGMGKAIYIELIGKD